MSDTQTPAAQAAPETIKPSAALMELAGVVEGLETANEKLAAENEKLNVELASQKTANEVLTQNLATATTAKTKALADLADLQRRYNTLLGGTKEAIAAAEPPPQTES